MRKANLLAFPSLFLLIPALLLTLGCPPADDGGTDTTGGEDGDAYAWYDGPYPPSREPWYRGLTPEEADGLETWYLWTGYGEGLYRNLAKETHGGVDFLVFAQTPRGERFEKLGAINNPDCRARTEPDEYGLMLDDCDDPHDTGIMGLRKFKNPAFDAGAWSYQEYLDGGAQLEPPWLIGISCGICHVAYNPIDPPADFNEPGWENILPAFGNQYILESAFFAGEFPEDAFELELLRSQQPGTSDTSRNATDHINGPTVINSIQNTKARLAIAEKEKMQGTRETHPFLWEDTDENGMRPVPHVLKDGADSVGVPGATLRVYVNIGMCWEYWLTLHDFGQGREPQQPFDIETARAECKGWQETEAKAPNAEKYLLTQGPLYLKDAPGGEAYMSQDMEVLRRGALAFADACARCHSSKPEPEGLEGDARADWYLSDDFRDGNFLSDDKRHPVTETQTNIARAMGTNAGRGHIWDNFSSETFKNLPSAGKLTGLYNPVTDKYDVDFELPAGGRGYYRTPTLVSIWATAPYLHNNSVGKRDPDTGHMDVGDPSLESRMEQYQIAMEKLLWRDKRDHWVKRTTKPTVLRVLDGKVEIPIPEGYPINLLGHLNTAALPENLDLKAVLRNLRPNIHGFVDAAKAALGESEFSAAQQVMNDFLKGDKLEKLRLTLLELSQAPDFIEDRGHYFAEEAGLSDDDKRALIEFVKTL